MEGSRDALLLVGSIHSYLFGNGMGSFLQGGRVGLVILVFCTMGPLLWSGPLSTLYSPSSQGIYTSETLRSHYSSSSSSSSTSSSSSLSFMSSRCSNEIGLTPQQPTDDYAKRLSPILIGAAPGSEDVLATTNKKEAKKNPSPTLKLLHVLTGGRPVGDAADDFDTSRSPNEQSYYALRSIFPFEGGISLKNDPMNVAFLLLRHPLEIFGITYSRQNRQRFFPYAGLMGWTRFRDAHFQSALDQWRIHVEYWLDNYRPHNRLVVSHHQLTHSTTGPLVVKEIAAFLSSRENAVPLLYAPADPNDNDHTWLCLWQRIFAEQASQRIGDEAMQIDGTERPWPHFPFTRRQVELTLQVFYDLRRDYTLESQLLEILDSFIIETDLARWLPPVAET